MRRGRLRETPDTRGRCEARRRKPLIINLGRPRRVPRPGPSTDRLPIQEPLPARARYTRRTSLFGAAPPQLEERPMFGWAIAFLIIAIIAAILGFGGIAGTAMAAAKIVFIVALIAFAISGVLGLTRRSY